MRIRLLNKKQRELILLAKRNKSWKELSQIIKIPVNYLSNDLKIEKTLLSDQTYNKLCNIANINFDGYILEKLSDNWGRSKGGMSSSGSLKKINVPEKNEKLAEFIGAVLGDGNINYYKKGSKIGVYQVKIAGHYNLDKDYHMNYLKRLGLDLFNLEGKEIIMTNQHGRFIVFTSKKLVEFFIRQGLKPGNKIKNQTTIPKWIFSEDKYIVCCLRGLIDTDGSIFKMSNQDPNLLRISFTNYCNALLKDTRKAFLKLGFFPSKIINEKRFFLSRKEDISKYLKEVGFSNNKHINRFNKLKSPVV